MSNFDVKTFFESETGKNFADHMKEITGNDTMVSRSILDEKDATLDQNRMIELTGNYSMFSRELIQDKKDDDKVDSCIFDEITTEGQAYVLGCFACAGSVSNENIWRIELVSWRRSILEKLRSFIGYNDTRIDDESPQRTLCVLNSQWKQMVRKLGVTDNCPQNSSRFPNLTSNLVPAFIRGCFEVNGFINIETNSCIFTSTSPEILSRIEEKIGVKGILSKFHVTFSGVNCLDFLAKIYEDSSPMFRFIDNYDQFCRLLTKYNTDIDKSWDKDSFKCLWKRNDPSALPLRKNRCSDSGYDLALIRKEKQLNQFTALYDTGISVSPPAGYYFDVVPRSSISKTGYLLANSTGIIDASYSGSIKVALLKADESVPDLVLPNYMVQLIPRKYIHFDFQEVKQLEETERSDKGFGSTENQTVLTK